MSLYQHERLVGHPRLDPSWITDSPIWKKYLEFKDYIIPEYIPDPPPDPWRVVQVRPDPVISIIGKVRSATEIEVLSVARVRAVSVPPGRAVALRARLIDAEGWELAHAPLYELAVQGAGCGYYDDPTRRPGEPPYTFPAMVPDVAPGAAIVIGADDRVAWERRAPERPPIVSDLHAERTETGTVRLRWRGEVAGEPSEAWVQWSDREGKIWHGLARGLAGREAEVSLTGVPAGVALLRILLHDGFFTTVSEPVTIEVPRRAPEAAILSPNEGDTLIAGGPMRLCGAATDSAGSPLAEESCLWILDGKEVGRGLDQWVEVPPAGDHRAVLIVHAEGHGVRHTVHFTTIGARTGR